MAARRRMAALALPFLLLPAGCGPADAVARFSTAATAALAAGEPVLRDVGGSCRRARALEDEIGSFAEPAADPACDAVAQQAEAAVAAAEALRRYFLALNTLATYGATDGGNTVGALATETAGLAGAGSTVQQAVGSLAAALAAHTAGLPQKRLLNKDLAAAQHDVGVIADALATVVQRNYLQEELRNEQRKLRTHYAAFAQAHPEGGVLLATDAQWHADQAVLARRREAAEALIAALRQVKEGTAALEAGSRTLRTQEAEARVAPFVAALQAGTVRMAKAF